MTPQNGRREYVQHRILTASPLELIRILYEAGVQALDEAMAALHAGDILGRGRAVTKAVEILSELRISLRKDVLEEYSNTLGELYGYMQQQLIRAHREQSEGLLLEVSRLLNTLLEAWVGAMKNLAASPGLGAAPAAGENSESVSVSNLYSLEPAGSRSESRSWQL